MYELPVPRTGLLQAVVDKRLMLILQKIAGYGSIRKLGEQECAQPFAWL
jgi:hypothetical protein